MQQMVPVLVSQLLISVAAILFGWYCPSVRAIHVDAIRLPGSYYDFADDYENGTGGDEDIIMVDYECYQESDVVGTTLGHHITVHFIRIN